MKQRTKISAILIDPFECKVSQVQFDGGDHEAMYPLMSHPVHPVDTFTTARVDILKANDALFVDDEGLFKSPVRWFQIAGGHQPFAGKGLIVGADLRGNGATAVTSINLVSAAVLFLERQESGRLVQTMQPFEVR
jgi:hypothetical protein